jgi:hypothetical protein
VIKSSISPSIRWWPFIRFDGLPASGGAEGDQGSGFKGLPAFTGAQGDQGSGSTMPNRGFGIWDNSELGTFEPLIRYSFTKNEVLNNIHSFLEISKNESR